MAAAPVPPARIILDANVIISAVIASDRMPPATLRLTIDRALAREAFVLTCPRLMTEVEQVLRHPRMARWIDAGEIVGVLAWVIGGSRLVSDRGAIVPVCRDPDDDYLVALAHREAASIVTGDRDLLDLSEVGVDVITVAELAILFGASS